MPSKRVTLVADELLGYVKTGGLGTAASFLALALARIGHRVEVLYVGAPPSEAMVPTWRSVYAEAGVAIRLLQRSARRVEPGLFARMCDTENALRQEPPDVVITEDLGAPTYTALRLRRLGLAFPDTRFVVNCYGTRRWITDMSAKVRVLPGAHLVTALERASLELADAVVSPSRYLVEWMREQGWPLPDATFVIPYYTRSAATGEAAPPESPADKGRVRRIAFFGRLEDRKGIEPFVEAVNTLAPDLLRDVELAFVGKATPVWPPARIEQLLSERVRPVARVIAFETELDQPEAIASLRRPGTLAVLPSYGESFGNAVRECLEHGVPFIAADSGAVPELVAPEDRERTLFPPTAAGIAAALEHRLTGDRPLAPARSALDHAGLDDLWEDVLAPAPAPSLSSPSRERVDVVVVFRGSQESLDRCLFALAAQTHGRVRVVVVDASRGGGPSPPEALPYEVVVLRAKGHGIGSARDEALSSLVAEWVTFLDEDDVPSPDFLVVLLRAQAASGADAVSCAIEVGEDEDRAQHFFVGEPGGLGVLANAYGTVALLRRSLLDGSTLSSRPVRDPDWPLLARLSSTGAQVVSVPHVLVARSAGPGRLEVDAAGAFLVLQQLEAALPLPLTGLARVAAGLAAGSRMPPRAGNGALPRLARRVRAALPWGFRP